MREELLGVGAHPGHLLRRRFPARCACILAGRVAQTGAGHELPHRLLRPVAAVGVVYVLDLGAHLRAIWQQFDHRRFVGDQRTHLAGVGGDQREPDNDATAAAEDLGQAPAERGQQAVYVVGLLLRRHVLGGVVAAAVADAARVVRHGL